MTDREIMQQALDALEYHTMQTRPIYQTGVVIELLEAELAKPEQEPVGMTCKVWTHGCALFDGIDLPNETLLYAAPTKREWVGLTDEEVAQIEKTVLTRKQAIKMIEHHLKEKNT